MTCECDAAAGKICDFHGELISQNTQMVTAICTRIAVDEFEIDHMEWLAHLSVAIDKVAQATFGTRSDKVN